MDIYLYIYVYIYINIYIYICFFCSQVLSGEVKRQIAQHRAYQTAKSQSNEGGRMICSENLYVEAQGRGAGDVAAQQEVTWQPSR